jgi:RNA polymerase sigma-70 factor (ECF subfamily)
VHALTETFELVRRAQEGDQAALEALFARYYERIRRVVRARIGPGLRRRLETGDILQRTFVKAVDVFDRFEMRDEGSLIHWLARIAEHQIRDAKDYLEADRRDARREVGLEVRSPDGDTTPLGRSLPAGVTAPLDRVARDEEHERLDAALDSLPANYREVIVLRDYEGLSWECVARESGRPSPDAARMLHKQALKELARALTRGDWTPESE